MEKAFFLFFLNLLFICNSLPSEERKCISKAEKFSAFKRVTDINDLTEESQKDGLDFYSLQVKGLHLFANGELLSPRYSRSGEFIIENWDIDSSHKVLDMGTGTGILALHASKQGAVSWAVDINPYSQAAIALASMANELPSKVHYIQSNLFQNVPKGTKFDRIVFNLPYNDQSFESESWLEKAIKDPDYATLKSFLKEAKGHLEHEGNILIALGQHSDLDKAISIMSKDYQVTEIAREERGHTRFLFRLTPKSESEI